MNRNTQYKLVRGGSAYSGRPKNSSSANRNRVMLKHESFNLQRLGFRVIVKISLETNNDY